MHLKICCRRRVLSLKLVIPLKYVKFYVVKIICYWDFPGGQWLRFHAPNAGGLGSIPDQGTRSYMLQLRVHMLQKILPAAVKMEEPACHN